MKRLIFGILAHVDAGKTTLAEAMLYRAGALRKLGRVDHGDAFLDTEQLEKDRGITIFAKQALLQLPELAISLLDTPGHADFSAEMERTLASLDYALLVISASDGVQSHTETLWRLLRQYRVPTFLFVNKMDLPGTDREMLLQELRSRLSPGVTDFTAVRAVLAENAATCSEALMEHYLESGDISPDMLRTAIARREVFPCWFGSALYLDGVDRLLDGFASYTRVPQRYEGFAARVIKVSGDQQGARLTWLAVIGGVLKVRDSIGGVSRSGEEWSEKASQLRIYSGAKFTQVEQVYPGSVCAVLGLSKTYPGQGLGAAPDAQEPVLEPVLSYQALPEDGLDVHTLLGKLRILEEEDPQLRVVWDGHQGCIQVQLMGPIQLEVLQSQLLSRFGMTVRFDRGSVLYKETIASIVEGVGHYEPLRHYAEVHLLLEPGERGSGLRFDSLCREDDLDRNWQRLILGQLQEKTHVGVLTGAPITDIRIRLVSGKAHLKHTEGGDFRQAAWRALRQGLMLAKSVLLEPWYDVTVRLPAENLGRLISDIQRKSGSFDAPESDGETAVLRFRAPAASMTDYGIELAAYTHGRGSMSCTPGGYAPCIDAEEQIAKAAYNPESDLENSPDSIFCAHGAGFPVKWDRVYSHMHLPLQQNREKVPAADSLAHLRSKAAAYCGTLEQDRELLKIFEKTYGPVSRDRRNLFSAPAVGSTAGRSVSGSGVEYLLVDGYNIIHAWEDLRELARESLDSARSKLIHTLCNYQGIRQCVLILVFDAYRVPGSQGSVEKVHNIHVVYTKEAETADMYIEKVSHMLAPRSTVRVATSDGLEQLIVLGKGASRVSAEAFRQEVQQVEAAIRDYLQSMG